MKKFSLLLCYIILVNALFSQNQEFSFLKRWNPTIKKEKLSSIHLVCEIAPGTWQTVIRPAQEPDKIWLNEKNAPQNYYIHSHENNYNDNKGIEYLYTEILIIHNTTTLSAKGTNDQLTPEQKSILLMADLGTDIRIKFHFKYKNEGAHKSGESEKIMSAIINVTVVPETEAEFPGGDTKFNAYVAENITSKIPGPKPSDKINQVVIKFTVDEEGFVKNARLPGKTSNKLIDDLILGAISKMPQWTPAKNSKGMKLKQEFMIRFGSGSGC